MSNIRTSRVLNKRLLLRCSRSRSYARHRAFGHIFETRSPRPPPQPPLVDGAGQPSNPPCTASVVSALNAALEKHALIVPALQASCNEDVQVHKGRQGWDGACDCACARRADWTAPPSYTAASSSKHQRHSAQVLWHIALVSGDNTRNFSCRGYIGNVFASFSRPLMNGLCRSQRVARRKSLHVRREIFRQAKVLWT